MKLCKSLQYLKTLVSVKCWHVSHKGWVLSLIYLSLRKKSLPKMSTLLVSLLISLYSCVSDRWACGFILSRRWVYFMSFHIMPDYSLIFFKGAAEIARKWLTDRNKRSPPIDGAAPSVGAREAASRRTSKKLRRKRVWWSCCEEELLGDRNTFFISFACYFVCVWFFLVNSSRPVSKLYSILFPTFV